MDSEYSFDLIMYLEVNYIGFKMITITFYEIAITSILVQQVPPK